MSDENSTISERNLLLRGFTSIIFFLNKKICKDGMDEQRLDPKNELDILSFHSDLFLRIYGIIMLRLTISID